MVIRLHKAIASHLRRDQERAIFYFASLVLLSLVGFLLPAGTAPSFSVPGADKVVHFFIFYTLAALGYFAYPKAYRSIVFFLACYAILIELVQMSIPGRTFDWWDIFADLSAIFMWILVKKRVG